MKNNEPRHFKSIFDLGDIEIEDCIAVTIIDTQESKLASFGEMKRKIIEDFADYLFKKCDVYVYKSDVEKYLKYK
jgi:hypothetical protein